MEQSQTPRSHAGARGFTIIELLVVVTVIAILAALLLPAIALVRGQAQSVTCLAHLRQVGIGAAAYTDEHAGLLPPTNTTQPQTWMELVDPYIGSADRGSHRVQRGVAWGCPAWQGYVPTTSGRTKTGYGATPYLDLPDSWANNGWNTDSWGFPKRDFMLETLSHPSHRILYGDCHDHHLVGLVKDHFDDYRPPTSVAMPGWHHSGERHGERSNVVYADLHCAAVRWSDYRRGLQRPDLGDQP